MTGQPRVVALLPGLAGPGGIQRHNRQFCRVLTRYLRAKGGSLDVVSLRDRHGWVDPDCLDRPVRGCEGNRYRFAAESIRALARPYSLLIVGVVDLGKGLLLRPPGRWKVPVLSIAHGIEVWARRPWYERIAFTRASRVLSVSEDTKRRLISEQGAQANRIVVIPNTIEESFLASAGGRARSLEPEPRSHLLSVARLNGIDRAKGIDDVIRALVDVVEFLPDVRYAVIGDGDDRDALECLAAELGLAGHVFFYGIVDDAELHAHFAHTQVFVLPSSKEGFGIVFLEAAAFGKPVIGGAHGGTPEVVADGETGLLVHRGDHEALARAIIALLSDASMRASMGSAGRARLERFRLPEFESRIVALIDDLLS